MPAFFKQVFLGDIQTVALEFSFPEKLPSDGVSIVSGKVIDEIDREKIHASAINLIRTRVAAGKAQAVLAPPENCSFWVVDFDSPGYRGDALFLSVATSCKAWVEILAQTDPEHSTALSELEQALQSEYRAYIAALLPKYRQLILNGNFNLEDDGFRPGRFFSVGNSGEESFFHLSTRLIVRDWLARKGLRIPLILYCPRSFGGDWSLAIWRMIIGSQGQTIVLSDASPKDFLEDIYETLQRIDWETSGIPVFNFPRPLAPSLDVSFPLKSFFQGDSPSLDIDSLLR